MLRPAAQSDATGPFDRRPTVGIVGTGIAGLGAAHRLHPHADITLFEASDWVGGHSHTVDATVDGVNRSRGHGLHRLQRTNLPPAHQSLRGTRVSRPNHPTCRSPLSAVSNTKEASRGMFADPRARFRPSHYAMIVDIVRFNAEARRASRQTASTTERHPRRVRRRATERPFAPATSSRWEQPSGRPRCGTWPTTRLRHSSDSSPTTGSSTCRNRPKWRTVTGGSRSTCAA